jgi:hypothetical protein
MEASRHLVAVGDERVDFEIAKAVEIGADTRHLGLHDRVQRIRVFVRVDHVRDRHKMKAFAVAEVFALELPNPVPEDVGRPDRLGHES